MHKLPMVSLWIFCLAYLLTANSCNSTPPPPPQPTNTETLPPSSIRGKKVSAKVLSYQSLATFENGAATLSLKDIADVNDKKINLVVLFDVSAPWANSIDVSNQAIENQPIKTLIDSYELTMLQEFDLDDENKGLVFDINHQNTPVEAARELSMIEHIVLVHVKEVPQEGQKSIDPKE